MPPDPVSFVSDRSEHTGGYGLLFVRLFIGGLLITAAVLKAWHPADVAKLATLYQIPPLLSVAIIQLELLLAAVLISGCWLRKSFQATALVFTLFACFSLYRAVAGYESCGCFGKLQVNPWLTFALDGFVVWLAATAARRAPLTDSSESRLKRSGLAGVVFLLTAIPLTLLAVRNLPTRIPAGSASLTEAGGLVILDPETWVGKPLPIADQLDLPLEFEQGRWVALFYHHDCPDCQAALPKYEKLAASRQESDSDVRIVLIEVPPYGETPIPMNSARHVKLPDDREWFVQAPMEVQVQDGTVTAASLELPSVAGTDSQKRGAE